MMKSNHLDITHLLSAVDQELSPGSEKGDPTEQQLQVSLHDRDLWSKFKELTNEMIVTKSGRRMFPVLKVNVSGLDPNAMYSFVIDFVQVENHRWKYVNGDWVPGGKAEPVSANAVYVHPDSPNFGAHWMKEPVSFSKVKLTNKMCGGGQIMLNSLHKYQPRVHIVRVGTREEKRTLSTHGFPDTQFVAVTAYQNEEITSLKIKYNPFAKAFQDAKERPDQRDFMGLDETDSDGRRLPHYPGAWFIPPTGHTFVPPPAHQFPRALNLGSHPCDRFSLRNHRSTPYAHHLQRRSPPHSSYQRETGANIPMLNMTDNWAHMSASHAHSVLNNTHQPSQWNNMMWNIPAPPAPPTQSCAVSAMTQYLRTSPPYTTSASTSSLPPTPDSNNASPPGHLNISSPVSSTGTPISLSAYDHSLQGAHDIDLNAATAGFHSPPTSARDVTSRVHSSWSPLTPPPL